MGGAEDSVAELIESLVEEHSWPQGKTPSEKQWQGACSGVGWLGELLAGAVSEFARILLLCIFFIVLYYHNFT